MHILSWAITLAGVAGIGVAIVGCVVTWDGLISRRDPWWWLPFAGYALGGVVLLVLGLAL